MQPSPEIEAIVRRLWSARKRGDLEVIDGLWSGSEYLLIIGSDQREWIEGSRESVMVAGKQIGEWPIEDSELKGLPGTHLLQPLRWEASLPVEG